MFGHPKMHENPFKNKTFESVRTFKNAQKFVQKHTHSKMYGHSKMRKISFTHTFTNVRIFKNRPQKRENAVQNNTHSKMCGYPKPSRNSTMCTPFFRSKTHTSETAHKIQIDRDFGRIHGLNSRPKDRCAGRVLVEETATMRRNFHFWGASRGARQKLKRKVKPRKTRILRWNPL